MRIVDSGMPSLLSLTDLVSSRAHTVTTHDIGSYRKPPRHVRSTSEGVTKSIEEHRTPFEPNIRSLVPNHMQ